MKLCRYCGDGLDTGAEGSRRNFCLYKSPDCGISYRNYINSLNTQIQKGEKTVSDLARQLLSRELYPVKPYKDEFKVFVRTKDIKQTKLLQKLIHNNEIRVSDI